MDNNKFKVVGVQVLPKKMIGDKPVFLQIPSGEIPRSYELFEKLVRPVNKEFEDNLRYEDSKNNSQRLFNVVAIVDIRKPTPGIDGEIIFNADKNGSMNVQSELSSLVRTIN